MVDKLNLIKADGLEGLNINGNRNTNEEANRLSEIVSELQLVKTHGKKFTSEQWETLRLETINEAQMIAEKLPADASVSDYIHDFVHSKNPRFEGKNKSERIRMALGAAYGAKAKGTKTNEEFDPVTIHSPGNSLHGMKAYPFHKFEDGRINVRAGKDSKGRHKYVLTLKPDQYKEIHK